MSRNLRHLEDDHERTEVWLDGLAGRLRVCKDWQRKQAQEVARVLARQVEREERWFDSSFAVLDTARARDADRTLAHLSMQHEFVLDRARRLQLSVSPQSFRQRFEELRSAVRLHYEEEEAELARLFCTLGPTIGD